MKVTVKMLEEADAEALFQFELDNREYFEGIGLGRPTDYYNWDTFQSILKELVLDQETEQCFMYLIRDGAGAIVGRANLVSVVRGSMNKAELGYRMGKMHQRKGYATEAVGLVIGEAATRHRLHRLEAGTSPDNIGSQIVLIKNGFQFVGRNSKYICKNGQWNDSILFERILD